jgi:hypothetical protein
MPPDINPCGSVAFLLVFIGVTGFVASLFAILMAVLDTRIAGGLARARIGLFLGPATALLGAFGILLGVTATNRGRATVDAAVASAGMAPTDAMRLRAQGYAEVGTCTGMGIQSGAMPLVAGLVATGIILARRRLSATRTA